MKKKILSALCAICLCILNLPALPGVAVFAEERINDEYLTATADLSTITTYYTRIGIPSISGKMTDAATKGGRTGITSDIASGKYYLPFSVYSSYLYNLTEYTPVEVTVDYYDDETFYHIVEIIMDQLTTNGPVVSYFGVFSDFYEGHNDTDYIYTYNESAQYQYDHAAIIVGYGYSEEQKKYYWILQDSRGTECHNNGFVKIEFGQVGTEQIAFSEPYVPQENPNVTDVYASLWKFDEKCYLYINITDNTYRNMTNTLELT